MGEEINPSNHQVSAVWGRDTPPFDSRGIGMDRFGLVGQGKTTLGLLL
jgi:hypothetical protein